MSANRIAARRRRLGAAVAAILMLAGVSASVAGLSAAASRHTGTLTGAILRGGGACCNPNVGGEVSIFHTNGRLVARQHVRSGRDFHFNLPPGRYLLNGGRQLHYRFPLGCAPKRARVRVGQTTNVDVYVYCGAP
jgi:hypothetical protein